MGLACAHNSQHGSSKNTATCQSPSTQPTYAQMLHSLCAILRRCKLRRCNSIRLLVSTTAISKTDVNSFWKYYFIHSTADIARQINSNQFESVIWCIKDYSSDRASITIDDDPASQSSSLCAVLLALGCYDTTYCLLNFFPVVDYPSFQKKWLR